MAALAIGGHLLGTIAGIQASRTGAMAAMFEGQVAAANAKAEAQAHKFNARVAAQQARHTRRAARAEARDFRRAGSALLASRRARAAASGVSATTGSPLMVDEKIISKIEFGADRIIMAGEVVATRQLNEAMLLKHQAKVAKENAKYAMAGARIGASAARLGAYTAIAQGAVGVGNTLVSKYG